MEGSAVVFFGKACLNGPLVRVGGLPAWACRRFGWWDDADAPAAVLAGATVQPWSVLRVHFREIDADARTWEWHQRPELTTVSNWGAGRRDCESRPNASRMRPVIKFSPAMSNWRESI